MKKVMKTTKYRNIVLMMVAALSFASCSSDDENALTEEEKANDLYGFK